MKIFCLVFSFLMCCSFTLVKEEIVDDFKVYSGWSVFTDQTLGGKSSAVFKIRKNGISEFKGALSMANSAGIAQIISPRLRYNIKKYKGFAVRIKGDGKSYNFALQDQQYCTNGVHYEFRITTLKDEWQVLRIPFSRFSPAYFGVPVNEPLPDLAEIKYISFSNTQTAGKFNVEIDYVKLY